MRIYLPIQLLHVLFWNIFYPCNVIVKVRFLYAYKNSQSHMQCRPHDISAFCCICWINYLLNSHVYSGNRKVQKHEQKSFTITKIQDSVALFYAQVKYKQLNICINVCIIKVTVAKTYFI